MKAIDDYCRVYIASSKHLGIGRIFESYANPQVRLEFFQTP